MRMPVPNHCGRTKNENIHSEWNNSMIKGSFLTRAPGGNAGQSSFSISFLIRSRAIRPILVTRSLTRTMGMGG